MKAKDYAKRLEGMNPESSEFLTALFGIWKDMMDEVGTIARSRHSDSNSNFAAAFLEIENKWKALAVIVPRVNKDGCTELLKHVSPDLYNDVQLVLKSKL